MDRKTWLDHYHNLPEEAQSYLLDELSSNNETAAQTKLAYENDVWDRVMDAVWDLIFTGSSKFEFREQLKPLIGDRKLDDVERIVLFHVVLPLADLVLWDVDTRLKELGMSESEIQSVPRVSLRPVSYGAAVRRIATQAKVSLLTEETVRRIREAFVSYIKGVRTLEQFREILIRSQGEGGLGLTVGQADAYISAMREFTSTTQVLSEQEYANWLSNMENEMEEKKAQEVAAAKKAGEQTTVAGTARANAEHKTALEEAVDNALVPINHPEWDEYLEKRVRNLISTRLRDVRNELQVKEVLGRDPKVGGLGLEGEELVRVAEIIEAAYKDHRGPIAEEEKARIEKTIAEQQSLIEERKKRDSEERSQWYEDKVKSTKRVQDQQAQAMAAFRQMSAGTETEASGISVEKSMASTVLDEQTVPRQTLDAVRAPVKLTGLTEELASMTIDEFRRLAKTPEQAAEKIRQKFETLKQESFERWTDGIQGWRNSPIQRQYLKLMTDSFAAGKPVAELVESMRGQDASLPTAEEIGAIISLNSQLQF